MTLEKLRISAPEGVLVRELEGEAVLLNLNTESYFGLDEVGTRMWEVLTSSESAQGAYETLLGEYEVQPEQLRQDIRDFIDKLAGEGLLEVGDG